MYFYLIRCFQHASKQTLTGFDGGSGSIKVVRTEWGVGKGRWKRRLLTVPGVKVKTRWFLVGARYTLTYEGSARSADAVWERI